MSEKLGTFKASHIELVNSSNNLNRTLIFIIYSTMASVITPSPNSISTSIAAGLPPTADGGRPSSSSTKSSDYIRTSGQNYISRTATIQGAQNLSTKGKSIIQSNTIIHGDYGATIFIGRYCYIHDGVVILPTVVPSSNDPLLSSSSMNNNNNNITSRNNDKDNDITLTPPPPSENEMALHVVIGSHTTIGSKTRIQSISVGSCVRIGSNCTLSSRSKVHDCCIIEDNTVIPPDMVIPPFSRVRGCPAKIVGILPECSGSEFVECCVQDYTEFVNRLAD